MMAGASSRSRAGGRHAHAHRAPSARIHRCRATGAVPSMRSQRVPGVRGETPRRTETGEAPGWQGARSEHIRDMRATSNAVQAGCIAGRMQRGFCHGLLAPGGPAMLGCTPGYVFGALAIRDRPSGIRARSILWHWIGDSRLRRRSTRRRGRRATGGAVSAPSFRVVAPCASPDRPAPPAGPLRVALSSHEYGTGWGELVRGSDCRHRSPPGERS